MNFCAEKLIETLRFAFTFSMIISAVRISVPAFRAITKKAQYLDPVWCMIFNFILSRLYFTWRAWYFSNPIDRPAEGVSLVAGYVWGISLYVALWFIYGWYNKPNRNKFDA